MAANCARIVGNENPMLNGGNLSQKCHLRYMRQKSSIESMSYLWTPSDRQYAREWHIALDPEPQIPKPHEPTIYRLEQRCESLRYALAGAALTAGVLGGVVIYLLAKG